MGSTAEDWSIYWRVPVAYGYDYVTDDYYKIGVDNAGRPRVISSHLPVFHYIHKPEFEIVTQSGKDASLFAIDSNFLLYLRAVDANESAWARAFFSGYTYDLSKYNRVGVMWYNDGHAAPANNSHLYIYTGSESDPTLTSIIGRQENFGSFASPTWSTGDLSSYTGKYKFMVQAWDETSIAGIASQVHVWFIYLWNETEL